MNNIKVEMFIEEQWLDYSKYAYMPLKFANLLDEQLDECELWLKRVPLLRGSMIDRKNIFKPLTLCRITITNNPSAKYTDLSVVLENQETEVDSIVLNENNTITETKTIYFIVANDNCFESPIGSELYNHTLYLIEWTKLMEGFIGDNLTFLNPLGNDYINS